MLGHDNFYLKKLQIFDVYGWKNLHKVVGSLFQLFDAFFNEKFIMWSTEGCLSCGGYKIIRYSQGTRGQNVVN